MEGECETRMKVLIVGCGLGGLSCAIQCLRQKCQVIILEKAPELLPIGAGIVVPPNAMRVLGQYGLAETLINKGGVKITGARFLNYHDGEVLYQRQMPKNGVVKPPGLQACVAHRAEYHETLYEDALRLGCSVRLGSEVLSVDFDQATVTLADGSVEKGDVVVGADGLWSTLRDQILGHQSPPVPTGDLAYRMTLSGETLAAIPDDAVQELLKPNMSTVWLGPDRHCVFYPIRNREQWNLVLMRPDNLPEGVRTQAATLEEMKSCFEGWDPRLQKLLNTGTSVLSWKLLHAKELETWTKGRVVLLGDACHPSLPYQAQGAAMALEDGITLGTLLGSLNESTTPITVEDRNNSIVQLIQLFEALRKPRTSLNQQGSQSNQFWYQASGPEEMERRNKVLRAADGNGPCEWKGADFEYQRQLLGFDAKDAAEKAFVEWKHKSSSL